LQESFFENKIEEVSIKKACVLQPQDVNIACIITPSVFVQKNENPSSTLSLLRARKNNRTQKWNKMLLGAKANMARFTRQKRKRTV
jgi:hypothetical protein